MENIDNIMPNKAILTEQCDPPPYSNITIILTLEDSAPNIGMCNLMCKAVDSHKSFPQKEPNKPLRDREGVGETLLHETESLAYQSK